MTPAGAPLRHQRFREPGRDGLAFQGSRSACLVHWERCSDVVKGEARAVQAYLVGIAFYLRGIDCSSSSRTSCLASCCTSRRVVSSVVIATTPPRTVSLLARESPCHGDHIPCASAARQRRNHTVLKRVRVSVYCTRVQVRVGLVVVQVDAPRRLRYSTRPRLGLQPRFNHL